MTPVLDGVHSVHAPFYNGSSSDAEAQTGTTSLGLSGAFCIILNQPNGYYMGCITVNGGDYNSVKQQPH